MSHHAANVLRWRPDWCFLISINTEVGYENVAAKKASTRLAFFVCAILVVIEWHDNNKKALLRGRLKRNRPSSEFFFLAIAMPWVLFRGNRRECEKAHTKNPVQVKEKKSNRLQYCAMLLSIHYYPRIKTLTMRSILLPRCLGHVKWSEIST